MSFVFKFVLDGLDNKMNFCREAQNAIRNINDLQSCVGGKKRGIFATFQHDKRRPVGDQESQLRDLPKVENVVVVAPDK